MKPVLQFFCLIFLACLLGCGHARHAAGGDANPAPGANGKIPVPVTTANKIIKDEKDLTGYWVGAIRTDSVPDTADYEGASVWDNATKINISIDAINGGQVKGHSINAGKFRPFAGTVEHTGNTWRFSVKEPGNDLYDGVFNFSIRTGDSVLSGTWRADHDIEPVLCYFDLTKRFFKYDPNLNLDQATYVNTKKTKNVKVKVDDTTEYTTIKYAMATGDYANLNASAKLLTTDQVANLKAADLLLLRNYIFARHGYAFKKPAIQSFFDQQDWYIPISTNVMAELTPIEKQNITLIKRYEKNAKEHYDSFGR
jgi:YARHG domain-containing protein